MSPDRRLVDRVHLARRGLAETGPVSDRRPGDFGRVSLPDADADVVRDWLVAERAQVVIEIGLAYGSSALAIAEALVVNGAADGAHLIIDAFQDQYGDVGWELLVSVGLADLCVLDRDRSQLVLPKLVSSGFVADAAFVDGSHVFHNVFVDLFFLGELVRPGGLVILDDCDWMAVATAARYFEFNAGWHRLRIERPTRLRAYRLPDPRVEPVFDAFVPFGG